MGNLTNQKKLVDFIMFVIYLLNFSKSLYKSSNTHFSAKNQHKNNPQLNALKVDIIGHRW